MREEVHVACEFLSRMLETKNLPVQFVNQFKKRLEELLLSRFENHWDTANPSKGSAYRCIRINGRLDPVIRDAAKVTGLSNISTYLPAEFTMWIDPKEVSYRFGEEGSICNCSLDSIRAENIAAAPAEWHRQLSTSPTRATTHRSSGGYHPGPQSPVSRSRTSPVPRRSPSGKYSPTPTSKRSLSPPLYYAAESSATLNHHHHHYYNGTQANSSTTTGYHQFPYSNYVIPVHV